MKKITFESFHETGLLADEDHPLDLVAQMDIFSHRFDIIPGMIRAGNLFKLSPATLELLASYLEGKVKTIGQFKRPEDKTKTFNVWAIGKIYEELADEFRTKDKRSLYPAIRERCKNLVGSNNKPLRERTIRAYFDEYELKRYDEKYQKNHINKLIEQLDDEHREDIERERRLKTVT